MSDFVKQLKQKAEDVEKKLGQGKELTDEDYKNLFILSLLKEGSGER